MIRHSRLLALIAGLLLLSSDTSADQPKEPANGGPSDSQIRELEKQIADLTRRLALLREEKAKAALPTKPAGTIPDEWVKQLTWRSIGPASMGGRIVSLAVYEADPTTYWVATASGGLIKTVNNGVTFEYQFQREATVSIGAVAVAPSNKDIVWVGTGEANPRNSVSYGDGVYKSTDGGKTWANMGLKESYQIGQIVIHPTNPDIVYVGALGRLYGPNAERGLFKTTNGGKTWERILFVDERTGVIDLVMHPLEPDTLLVATWERQRDEFDSIFGDAPHADNYRPIVTHGKGGGLFRTTDGGKSFSKITAGLPTAKWGRVGLDWYRKEPNVVFAIIDTDKAGTGTPPASAYLGVTGEDDPAGAKLTEVEAEGPAGKAGAKEGDIVQAADGKKISKYDDIRAILRTKKPGDELKLSVLRGQETKELVVKLTPRPGTQGPPVLGITAESVEGGVKISSLVENGAALKAGLKVGDKLTTIAGKPFPRSTQMSQYMAKNFKAGDKVKVTYEREGKSAEVELTLQAAPGRRGPSATHPYSSGMGGQAPNVQGEQGLDGFQTGGVFRSDDAGQTWKRINSINPRPMYFSVVRVDPSDANKLYVLGVSLYQSMDGGKTFRPAGRGIHADQHALWINPRDGRHMIIGTDGGFYVTYDRGAVWDHHNHFAHAQYYHVAIDPRNPARVYGGLQDNGTWGGPTRTLRPTGPVNEDWIFVNGGDGFVCRVAADNPDLVYYESQNGGMGRVNLKTGERSGIRPRNEPGKPPYRFNWNTPFILSSHNPGIFYAAGNYVFRSVNKGDNLRAISPEITRTSKGSATALSESPLNPEVLYVGTDDGALHVTRNGGATWDLIKTVPLPGPRWVSTIEASKYKEGRCYVVYDAHRSDDDKPYVFVTEDFGATWKPLMANLPAVCTTRVLREDIRNENLLYLGTEFGCWVSANRGASWTRFNSNLPTVAVHEFAQHPTNGEIVAATHGRSLWVADVTPWRQMTSEVLKGESAVLLAPPTAIRWRTELGRESVYSTTARRFVGENPLSGVEIFFHLPSQVKSAELRILDVEGKSMRVFRLPAKGGLGKVRWDLTQVGGPFGAVAAPSGMYRLVLTVDGKEISQPLRVERDPSQPALAVEEKEFGEG